MRVTLQTFASVLALLAAGTAAGAADGQWKLQYFFDQDQSELHLVDLQFRSPQRGIAVGVIERGDSNSPVALVTANGGARWDIVKLRDMPVSLFLLDDTTGWLVTAKGLWRTTEAGRRWDKICSEKGLAAVYFLDPNRGFAAGSDKRALSTADGGRSWTPIAAAATLPGTPARTVFDIIEFVTPRVGMILGWNRPESAFDTAPPAWMEPERVSRLMERPHLVLQLETADGGKTWKGSSSSIFGRVSRMRLGSDQRDFGLLRFRSTFTVPSEVVMISGRTRTSETVYRQPDRVITDLIRPDPGTVVIAGIETAGKLADSPIPGKVHILTSPDQKDWREMPVDYRATGWKVMLATGGQGRMWAATDTGMILHWLPAPGQASKQ